MPCASRKEALRSGPAVKIEFMRTRAVNYGIIIRVKKRIVAFYASVGSSETWKVQRVCQTKWRMRPVGCISLSWVTQGFSRASDETRKKSAPSFFARDRNERAKGKTKMSEPNVCKQCGRKFTHHPVGVMTTHAWGGDTHGFCSEGCKREYEKESGGNGGGDGQIQLIKFLFKSVIFPIARILILLVIILGPLVGISVLITRMPYFFKDVLGLSVEMASTCQNWSSNALCTLYVPTILLVLNTVTKGKFSLKWGWTIVTCGISWFTWKMLDEIYTFKSSERKPWLWQIISPLCIVAIVAGISIGGEMLMSKPINGECANMAERSNVKNSSAFMKEPSDAVSVPVVEQSIKETTDNVKVPESEKNAYEKNATDESN